MKKKQKSKTIFRVLLMLGIGMGILAGVNHGLKIKADLDRLKTQEYDAVFFAMFSTQNYEEEDWMYFREMQVVKTDYEIPNTGILEKYITTATQYADTIKTAYLGVDPTKVKSDELVLLLQEHPQVFFEIILAYPDMEYWTRLGQGRYEKVLEDYKTLSKDLVLLENVRVHLMSGEAWLICNPLNYVEGVVMNEEVSEFLMCNMDVRHPYYLTQDNIQMRLDAMQSVIDEQRARATQYPDAEKVEIVFLGDSIIGNFTNSMSVPKVVSGLSGATVYNCGYSGRGAALHYGTEIAFPQVVDALLAKDVSSLPPETLLRSGVQDFLEREPSDKQLMFVINYGLNDYFYGAPLETEDAYDITSYSGALRSGIEKLKNAYPQAQILIMTPNFTTYFHNGQDINGEQAGDLEDYVNVVLEIASEQQIDVLDNYRELPITAENSLEYQDDGCHLNERGRFLVGSRIAQKIRVAHDK